MVLLTYESRAHPFHSCAGQTILFRQHMPVVCHDALGVVYYPFCVYLFDLVELCHFQGQRHIQSAVFFGNAQRQIVAKRNAPMRLSSQISLPRAFCTYKFPRWVWPR